MKKTLLVALLLASCVAVAQEGPPPAIVSLGDGNQVPLRPWALSYELISWKQGQSPAFAQPSRVTATELWIGKKTYPVAGTTLEIQYEPVMRTKEIEGETKTVKVPVATALIMTGADGKKTTLKLAPPTRELLMPTADKNLFVQPRSLDLHGQSLTGTKREFCLLSYTTLVECGENPADQVVKIEFQK